MPRKTGDRDGGGPKKRLTRRKGGDPRSRDGRPGDDAVAVGFHAVKAALTESPKRVDRLLLARGERSARTQELVRLARKAGIPFNQVPGEALDRLASGVGHQGIAAKLSGAELVPRDDLIESVRSEIEGGGSPIVVIVDGVTDVRNVGAIARSAAAFGAAGIFMPTHRSSSIGPGAVKAAAGALARLTVARAGNVARLLDDLNDVGMAAIALDSTPGGDPPWKVDLTGPVALVLGGEESGIRPGVLKRCVFRMRIPIRDEVESLNVSVPAGITLAELSRQRSRGAGRGPE